MLRVMMSITIFEIGCLPYGADTHVAAFVAGDVDVWSVQSSPGGVSGAITNMGNDDDGGLPWVVGDVVTLWRGRGHSQVRDLDGMHDIRDPGPADEASTINAAEVHIIL